MLEAHKKLIKQGTVLYDKFDIQRDCCCYGLLRIKINLSGIYNGVKAKNIYFVSGILNAVDKQIKKLI